MRSGVPHKLVDHIQRRPGEFETAVSVVLLDNDQVRPNKRLTHLDLDCEICGQRVTILAYPRHNAEIRAKSFDEHPCKLKEEWPPREEEAPHPRMSPAQRRAEREERGPEGGG
jgi:hypothetical protein